MEIIDSKNIPSTKGKWTNVIEALKELPKNKAIKLKIDTNKEIDSLRQKIYREIGTGIFSVYQSEGRVYIKHMENNETT